MPRCKYCNSRITKFDKDICPICGEKQPLVGVTSETVEITSNLDLSEAELKNFKPSTKAMTCALFCLLGWTGAPLFYLNYYNQALIWLFANVVVIAGVGSILAFLTPLGPIWGFLIVALGIYLVNIICGIFAFFKHNLRDGKGEFLR